MVSKCCQRIIGCNSCVFTWLETSSRCPLCSLTSQTDTKFELKGFDDISKLLSIDENPDEIVATNNINASDEGNNTDNSSDFEAFPPFHRPIGLIS